MRTTMRDGWWKAAVPALAALLACSCGRSLTLDEPPKINGGAGGSSPASSDGGDAQSAGIGGMTGTGGTTGSGGADAGMDRQPTIDATKDVVDVRPDVQPDIQPDLHPDLPPDRPPPPPDVGGCPANCNTLPHVRAGAYVPCINGVCSVGYGTAACETGFSHCSTLPNVGCETDVSASPNCGSCGSQCYAGYECRLISGGYYYCAQPCAAPETACDFSCVDLQNDPNNCGACGKGCFVPNTMSACQQGLCVTLGCIDSTAADCDGTPGCETVLGNDPNCGGCNDPACTLANTMYTCSDGLGCTASVCEVGFANCDASNPNCETVVASTAPTSGGCLPQYVSSVGLATQQMSFTTTALGADGSFFIAGTYMGTVDFDPSSTGRDIRTAQDVDGYVTKFNADGSYAWTATLSGRGVLSLQALAATPAGGVVASGWYADTIDLDPSAAQDVRVTNDASNDDTYVLELSASGAEVWGRTFPGMSFGSTSASNGIAVDVAGAVYVVGSFFGTVDFDLGAGGDLHTASLDLNQAFLVKLTNTGDRVWSRIVDDADCATNFQSVTLATDGSAWTTGLVAQSSTCALASPNGPYASVLIMKMNAAGDTRTIWTLGDGTSSGSTAIAAGRNGAVYIGGTASADTDMDPGPGVARRWFGPLYSPAGFVLKLAADGTYQWARVLSSASQISALAPTPDGGVLAVGRSSASFAARLTESGASVWTFPVGSDAAVVLVSAASSATAFAVAGTSSGTQDLDPGPGIDLIFGDIALVSRFKF